MKECNDRCNVSKYTIEYYSNKWNTYDCNKIKTRIQNFNPYLEKILDMIEIKEKMCILDIGTGPGTIPIAIMEKYGNLSKVKIYGIDPSSVSISNSIKIVEELGLQSQIFFKMGSFEDIPFSDDYFDLIISNASFNLCTDKVKAIDEIIRVVKNSGKIIIADCFRKDQDCQSIEDNEELWAHCISGAVTINWLVSSFKIKNFNLKLEIDLTEIVKSLIVSEKWKWNEFIDFNLDYYTLLFSSK